MGQTEPGRRPAPAAVDDPRATGHPGRRRRPRPGGLRLRRPRPRRSRGDPLHRRPGPRGEPRSAARATASASRRPGSGRAGSTTACARSASPSAPSSSCANGPSGASRSARRWPEQGVVREWIAQSRVRIEQLRLLVLKTAWLMDTVGNRGAHIEIQAIKIAVPETVQWILDRAIQIHGAGGLSQDFPLAESFAGDQEPAARRRAGRGAPDVPGPGGDPPPDGAVAPRAAAGAVGRCAAT